jgi:predicted DNA-binding transcriptional regulator AlpA
VHVIPDGYLLTDDAAAHLGITRQTFDNQAQTEDFPKPLRIGRTPLWPIAELDAWRKRHPARRKTE